MPAGPSASLAHAVPPGKPCPLLGTSLCAVSPASPGALERRRGSLTCVPSSLEYLSLRWRWGHLCASLSVLLESRVYATARIHASSFRPAESGNFPSPHCSPVEQVSSQCAQVDPVGPGHRGLPGLLSVFMQSQLGTVVGIASVSPQGAATFPGHLTDFSSSGADPVPET